MRSSINSTCLSRRGCAALPSSSSMPLQRRRRVEPLPLLPSLLHRRRCCWSTATTTRTGAARSSTPQLLSSRRGGGGSNSSGGGGGSSGGDDGGQSDAGGGAAAGYASLVAVTLLWGSYAPALRYLFEADARVTPALLTAARAAVSAAALLAITGGAALWQRASTRNRSRSSGESMSSRTKTKNSSSSSSISSDGSQGDGDAGVKAALLLLAPTLLAGCELGAWNFAGTACQAVGLELTTATRAAFLVQATGALTPVLARALGQRVPAASWLGCAVALLGSVLIVADGTGALGIGSGSGGSGSSTSDTAAVNVVAKEKQQQQQQQTTAKPAALPSVSARGFTTAAAAAPPLVDAPTAAGRASATTAAVLFSSGDGSGTAVLDSSGGGGVTGDGDQVEPPSSAITAADAYFDAPASLGGVTIDSAAAQRCVASAADPDSDLACTSTSSSSSTSSSDITLTAAGTSASAATTFDKKPTVIPSIPSSGGTSTTNSSSAPDKPAPPPLPPPPPPPPPRARPNGDGALLAACAFYALGTVRLSVHAPRHGAGALAACKAAALAVLSIAWLALSGGVGGGIGSGSGDAGATAAAGAAPLLPPALAAWPGAAVLLYSALGPGALASYLQARGQAAVAAPRAQVVFALTPLFAAALAPAAGLSGEGLGPLGWAGAAAVVAATAGVAWAPQGAERPAGGDEGGGRR